jgi:hypothetical protein
VRRRSGLKPVTAARNTSPCGGSHHRHRLKPVAGYNPSSSAAQSLSDAAIGSSSAAAVHSSSTTVVTCQPTGRRWTCSVEARLREVWVACALLNLWVAREALWRMGSPNGSSNGEGLGKLQCDFEPPFWDMGLPLESPLCI